MLSDKRIAQAIRWRGLTIAPFNAARMQPASIDLTLAPELLQLRTVDWTPLDPKRDNAGEYASATIGPEGYVIRPGQFVLGSTVERITMGRRLKGRLEGKSSLGRLGLEIHRTAGYIDPGFDGHITLELSAIRSIILYSGMPIAQLAFYDCSGVEHPYEGKYLGQIGPTVSRYHLNWNGEKWV